MPDPDMAGKAPSMTGSHAAGTSFRLSRRGPGEGQGGFTGDHGAFLGAANRNREASDLNQTYSC